MHVRTSDLALVIRIVYVWFPFTMQEHFFAPGSGERILISILLGLRQVCQKGMLSTILKVLALVTMLSESPLGVQDVARRQVTVASSE